eukprot:2370760-Heterocapsa_arctica.AAC.1
MGSSERSGRLQRLGGKQKPETLGNHKGTEVVKAKISNLKNAEYSLTAVVEYETQLGEIRADIKKNTAEEGYLLKRQ